MLKQTLAFYTGFLHDVGFKVEDDESISRYNRNKSGVGYLPVTTGGLPLVIGSKEQLDKGGDSNIIYHPLTEDALKGESYTIKITKEQMNRMLAMRFLTNLRGLGEALVTKRSSKVTAKQTKLFNQNPDFDEKALSDLIKIVGKAKSSVVNRHLVGIYLHSKGVQFEGHPVKRLAKVSSSLRDALESKDKDVWGVEKISRVRRKAIIQLIDTILPGVNEDAYTHGSNNKTAPYFDAMTNAFLNLSYQLDTIEHTCSSLYNDELMIKPKYEWVDKLTNLAKLAAPIPPLRGNMGNDVVGQAAFSVSKNTPEIKESATPQVDQGTPNQPTPNESTPTPSTPASDSTHPFFNNSTPEQVANVNTGNVYNPTMAPVNQMPQQNPAMSHLGGGAPVNNTGGSHPFLANGNNQMNTMQNTGMPMGTPTGNGMF